MDLAANGRFLARRSVLTHSTQGIPSMAWVVHGITSTRQSEALAGERVASFGGELHGKIGQALGGLHDCPWMAAFLEHVMHSP